MKTNKTVLITVSSKGLGEDLSQIFAKNNYNIILHGRDIVKLYVSKLPDAEEYSILHNKDIKRQEKQNNFYSKINI